MTNKTLKVLGIAALVSAAACNLDKTNPNAPTQGAIFSDRQGIVSLAIGLQARYGSGMSAFIYPGGLISDEMGAPTGALQSYKDAETGALADTYDAVEAPWRTHYQTIKTANDLIFNAGKVALGDETLSGIMSLSYLLKAAELSNLIQQYQQVITNPESASPTFVARGPALTNILGLLDTAQTQANKFGARTEFDGSILAKGFSLRNTIYAMQARNQRLAKNWTAALAAANLVDTSVVSVMPFTVTTAPNPMYQVSITNVRPRDTLRLAAETGDARVAFHISGSTVAGTIRPLRTFTQFAEGSSIAVYWPGEIMLIRAEANANLGQLTLAAQQVNYVRTRCGGAANQPKACLQPVVLTTQDQILAEIYKQRKFELFSTGLRWEDVRRQGLVSATSAFAKRCWLLYPNSERNVSAGVPANPVDPPAAFSSCGV